jgi:hypothetical protein
VNRFGDGFTGQAVEITLQRPGIHRGLLR